MRNNCHKVKNYKGPSLQFMFESQAILKDQAWLLKATIVKLIQKYTPHIHVYGFLIP